MSSAKKNCHHTENAQERGRFLTPIAYMQSDLKEKFGIPRQSGLVPSLTSRVVFTETYADERAVKGLESFSHIWLIWDFSLARTDPEKGWSATVRPPRLGGNERMGVFATRSPFRPNALGLSCVSLLQIEYPASSGGELALLVGGADLADGTPIYDVKPYIPYADARPEAASGFAGKVARERLQVHFEEELLLRIPEEKRQAVLGILAEDPRPAYQHDPARIYGLSFAGFNIRFTVRERKLRVCSVEDIRNA